MKCKLLFLFALAFCLSFKGFAQKPMGGCWHPDDIKNWSPETDPDAKFNRSRVPLQERFVDKSIKASPYGHWEGQVTACLTMNPMCSQCPSQGDDNFTGYSFSFWQYVDILVWWGGSAGEGIVIPPSAPVVDAAHQQGVKVYGNIFFPPGAFGGQREWVREMLKVENGEYPYAKKLAEICKYYGFDGWFINEETGGGSQGEWVEFAKTFNKYKEPHMGLQWYDCGTTVSDSKKELFWSDNQQPFTSYFLNYGSAKSSYIASNNKYVEGLGLDPFFVNYYGLEIGGGGFAHGKEFRSIFQKDGHSGSVDLFCPEAQTWKKYVERDGLTDYEAMNKFFETSSRFWVNINHDPTDVSDWGRDWPGMAAAVVARTTIQKKPFLVSFNAGLGKKRYYQGDVKGTGDWYHRGMQDILPTWRWWIEGSEKTVGAAFNFDDAYNGGSCLKVDGELKANISNNLRLYKTKLAVENGDKLQLVYKPKASGATNMYVGLAFSENKNTFTYLPVGNGSAGSWNTKELDLSEYAGKTISMISIKFESSSAVADYQMQLGQLGISNGSSTCSAVSNIVIQRELGGEDGDLRITWDEATGALHHYNVYLTQNGVEKMVGQTKDEGFYVSKIKRSNPSETGVAIRIVSVGKDLKEKGETSSQANWSALVAPIVKITADYSLIKPNGTVRFKAVGDNFTDSYVWEMPTDAEKVSESSDKSEVEYRFPNMGVYDITCTASNSVGSTKETVSGLVTVTHRELENVSVGKIIHSVSGNIDKHPPRYIIDGDEIPKSLDNKWCVGGEKSHWTIIDLEEPFKIYRFKAFDTGHKEDASGNYNCYKIWVSNDLENWTEVVNEKGRQTENTKEDACAGIVGRYVKFNPYDEDLAITIRIWEFEVLGIPTGLDLASHDNIEISDDETTHIEMSYSLGENPKAGDFGVTVTPTNDFLAVSNVAIKEAEGLVSFDLKGKSGKVGFSGIEVKLTNGGFYKTTNFKVTVASAAWTNIALNKTVTFQTKSYSGVSGKPQSSADADKVVDGDASTGQKSGWYGMIHYIDLGKTSMIYKLGFKFDASLSLPGNIKVEYSADSENWTAVTSIKDLSAEINIFLDNPFMARYLKVSGDVANWHQYTLNEIEAFGVQTNLGLGEVSDLSLGFEKTQAVSSTFTLGGDAKEADFAITAESSDANLFTVQNFSIDEANGKVSYDILTGKKNGVGSVTVFLTNGSITISTKYQVTVEPENMINVSEGKSVIDFSGSTTNETPDPYLLDGITVPSTTGEKWCEVGGGKHYVVIDLGQEYALYKFMFHDAGVKESTDMNSPSYTIAISKDNAIWEEVVNVTGDMSDVKTAQIDGKNARYVKFMPSGENGGGTCRIFEFQAFGTEELLTGINDTKSDNGVETVVFPNPFTEEANLTLSVKEAGKVNVSIMNVTGMTVKHLVSAKLANGVFTYQWNGTNEAGVEVPVGIYLVSVKTAKGVKVYKLRKL